MTFLLMKILLDWTVGITSGMDSNLYEKGRVLFYIHDIFVFNSIDIVSLQSIFLDISFT